MGYFKRPDAQPAKRLPALPPPGIPENWIRCTKCTGYRPPSKFESKGIRAGRQVRRKVCEDCRQFKKRVLRWAARERVYANERERACKECGKTFPITEFPFCGASFVRQYRLHTCRKCGHAYARQWRRWKNWGRLGKRAAYQEAMSA